ncbi:DUF971 domain-containing protein [bacterium]|nr:DUF971 domain-containing protein [bacterium]
MQTPLRIQRLAQNNTGTGLAITWNDGLTAEFSSGELRSACPCATCQEQRGDTSHSQPLGGAAARPSFKLKVLKSNLSEETDLQAIWAIGQYALGMRWGDQHDSGIYSFALLRELSETKNKNRD